MNALSYFVVTLLFVAVSSSIATFDSNSEELKVDLINQAPFAQSLQFDASDSLEHDLQQRIKIEKSKLEDGSYEVELPKLSRLSRSINVDERDNFINSNSRKKLQRHKREFGSYEVELPKLSRLSRSLNVDERDNFINSNSRKKLQRHKREFNFLPFTDFMPEDERNNLVEKESEEVLKDSIEKIIDSDSDETEFIRWVLTHAIGSDDNDSNNLQDSDERENNADDGTISSQNENEVFNDATEIGPIGRPLTRPFEYQPTDHENDSNGVQDVQEIEPRKRPKFTFSSGEFSEADSSDDASVELVTNEIAPETESPLWFADSAEKVSDCDHPVHINSDKSEETNNIYPTDEPLPSFIHPYIQAPYPIQRSNAYPSMITPQPFGYSTFNNFVPLPIAQMPHSQSAMQMMPYAYMYYSPYFNHPMRQALSMYPQAVKQLKTDPDVAIQVNYINIRV